MLPSVRDQLIARWGDDVLDGDTLNRSAIAEIVFDSDKPTAKSELDFLESITHPEIKRILAERLDKMSELDRFPIAVLDAAIMMKAGWDSICDRIVFVDAPIELRRKRAQLRGLELEQFEAREASQTPVEEKKQRADIIIDNSGPPQSTFQQVEEVWQSLLQIA